MAEITIFSDSYTEEKVESSAPSDVSESGESYPDFRNMDLNSVFRKAIKESAGNPIVPNSAYLDDSGVLHHTGD